MVVARICGVSLAFALLFGAPAAFAHAFLDRSSPAVGSSIQAAPAALSLRFTEAVEPRFSSIALLDAQGTAVTTGPARAADDGLSLVVPLPPLRPGTYTVIWHVTSVDTHKTEGRFSFTVKE
ncbi:MAG: copper homeostasis periplasmic binding protein CopC [Acetobacteraceae bacterium]|nr:copper homeostasis periplasmic binding protein CopC [Acetobacteraceae bacterium]